MTLDEHIPHPLDENDDETTLTVETSDQRLAYGPLLRPSLFVLITSFVVALMAGLWAATAGPNSVAESTGSMINRIAIIVMLASFVLILVSYRIPHLMHTREPQPEVPRRARWWTSLPLILFHAAVLLLGVSATSLFSSLAEPNAYFLIIFFEFTYLALLITTIVWHQGAMRAYAIGATTGLVSHALVMLTFLRGPSSVLDYWISLFPVITCGLLCAAYVQLFLYLRAPDR